MTVEDNLVLGDGGWAVALHVKTAPARGNAVEDVRFLRNRVHNVTACIRLETAFQARDPGER